jgi:transcriptional regulator with XRE-family HTH domain
MTQESPADRLVRARLRGLRRARGWTLDELSARCFISASTLSRIETARQRVSLDQLSSIAQALGTTLDTLVDSSGVDDVVIRPQHHHDRGMTIWQLDAAQGRPETTVVRLRLTLPAPVGDPDALRVHAGNEWLMVLSGTVQLLLDDRSHVVDAGDAASFSTMIPHAMGALDGPAEVLLVLDRDGDRVHQHL